MMNTNEDKCKLFETPKAKMKIDCETFTFELVSAQFPYTTYRHSKIACPKIYFERKNKTLSKQSVTREWPKAAETRSEDSMVVSCAHPF